MPCYRAKKNHTSNPVNKPGVGSSWGLCWKLVPCCSTTSSTTGSTTSSSNTTGTQSSSSNTTGTQSSSSNTTGTQSSSSTTTSATSSSSTSPQPSQSPGYRGYRAYPCGTWDVNDCSTTWHSLGSGIPTMVWHTADTPTKWNCTDVNGSIITYTIVRAWGITGLTDSTCVLLVRDDSMLSNAAVSNMYMLGATGTQNCGNCALTFYASSPSMQP